MPDLAQVSIRNVSAAHIPFVKVSELHPQDCSLNLVQATVISLLHVFVLLRRTVIGKPPNAFNQGTIVSRDRPAVTVRTEILRRVEAPCGQMTERADTPSPIAGSMRLTRILNHPQLVGTGKFEIA